jgi:hypothetical protein
MKQLAYFLLFGVFSLSVTAQKNFQPGYIIYNNGDTVQGYINYSGWESSPRKIEFKKGEGENIERYSVSELSFFKVINNDAYKKAVIWKDMAPVKISSLKEQGYKEEIRDTVFLREIVKGNRFALYESIDEKAHYYIADGNNKPEELIYKVFYDQNDHSRIHTLYTFRDQLKRFTSVTNEKFYKLIERALYRESDLTKILLTLDNTATTAKKENGNAGLKTIQPFIGGGVVYNHIAFINNESLEGFEGSSSTYSLTAGINLVSKRNLQRLFVRIGLAYSSYKWGAEKEAPVAGTAGTQIESNRYDLKINTFSLGPILNYSFFRTSSVKSYLGAGLVFNFSTYPVNIYTTDNETTGVKRTREDYLDFEKIWLDFTGRIGLTYKNLDFSLNRRLAGSFSPNYYFGAKYVSTSFITAYQF